MCITGNILMLSEAQSHKVFSLREGRFCCICTKASIDGFKGILTLYLEKESYERAGLEGKPDGAKGNRGTKPRWGQLSLAFKRERVANFRQWLRSIYDYLRCFVARRDSTELFTHSRMY